MQALLKMLFPPPKVQVFNPDHSILVSNLTWRRLCGFIAALQGVVFTRKPRLFGSSALPLAEFRFRELMFQIDDGGDIGGDGLWIEPKDGLPHPAELREIREHVERLILEN